MLQTHPTICDWPQCIDYDDTLVALLPFYETLLSTHHRGCLSRSSRIGGTTWGRTHQQCHNAALLAATSLCALGTPFASLTEPQLLESFQRKNHCVRAQLFSEAQHVTSSALAMRSKLRQPALKVYVGSIMVHMEGFDQQQPDHVETMKRALTRLSQKFPTAGLVLQLGDQFYRYNGATLEVVPWVSQTPPPVVSRMSAIKLPRHGRCVLVEGENLNIVVPPSPAEEAAQSLVALSAASDRAGGENTSNIQLRSVPDPPLVLYCIQSDVLKAEKLQAMFSTPDGKKALFAAPVEPLPAEGTVTLRLRRGHAFSPDVTMTTTWLQASVSDVGSRMGKLNLEARTPRSQGA